MSDSYFTIVLSHSLSTYQYLKLSAEQKDKWKTALADLKAGVKRNRFSTQANAERALALSGLDAANYYVTEAMDVFF